MIDVAMRVWNPLGKTYKVMTIVSDTEHLGNFVAEGKLHPSMFWPTLAKLGYGHSNRNWQKYVAERDENIRLRAALREIAQTRYGVKARNALRGSTTCG